MPINNVCRLAKKSTQREWVVDEIIKTLSDYKIFTTLDYRRKNEAYLKQYMHQPLQAKLLQICRKLNPGVSDKTIESKAAKALFWEGDVKTPVNNIPFLGVQHRPDFKIEIGGIKIAVEVKRGESGYALREGLGQSLVYASCDKFDFVAYLFVDISRDKKILNAMTNPLDKSFIESLWEHHNIKFAIV
jgi:hypothetical protein